jgi:superfamily II DNA helicase RecQ
MITVILWTKQVVVIIVTSEGKSLLFMLPYILPNTGITILVLLLMFLQKDLLYRVRELGIDYLV